MATEKFPLLQLYIFSKALLKCFRKHHSISPVDAGAIMIARSPALSNRICDTEVANSSPCFICSIDTLISVNLLRIVFPKSSSPCWLY